MRPSCQRSYVHPDEMAFPVSRSLGQMTSDGWLDPSYPENLQPGNPVSVVRGLASYTCPLRDVRAAMFNKCQAVLVDPARIVEVNDEPLEIDMTVHPLPADHRQAIEAILRAEASRKFKQEPLPQVFRKDTLGANGERLHVWDMLHRMAGTTDSPDDVCKECRTLMAMLWFKYRFQRLEGHA